MEAKRKLPPELGKLGVHGPPPLHLEFCPTSSVRQLRVLCVWPPVPGGHRELVCGLRGLALSLWRLDTGSLLQAEVEAPNSQGVSLEWKD